MADWLSPSLAIIEAILFADLHRLLWNVGRLLVLDLELALVQYLQVALLVKVLLIDLGWVYCLPVINLAVMARLTIIQQVFVLNCVDGCFKLMWDALRPTIILLRELSLLIYLVWRLTHSLHIHHAVLVRLIRLPEREWKVAGWALRHKGLHRGHRVTIVLHEPFIWLMSVHVVRVTCKLVVMCLIRLRYTIRIHAWGWIQMHGRLIPISWVLQIRQRNAFENRLFYLIFDADSCRLLIGWFLMRNIAWGKVVAP